VEVSLVHIGPDDAVGDREVRDLMERGPKLEDSGGREEVARIRVPLREDRGAVSNRIEGKVIDRVDERERPVAPVDAGCVFGRALDVEALGGLDALKAQDVGSDDRPCEVWTTVVRNAGLEDRTGDGVARPAR
jgi:hypothetical protein